MQAYVARACVCGTRPTRRTVHTRTTEPRASNRNGRLILQGRSANSCSRVGLSRGAIRRVTFRLCLVGGRRPFVVYPPPLPSTTASKRCPRIVHPATLGQRHPFHRCAQHRMINILIIKRQSTINALGGRQKFFLSFSILFSGPYDASQFFRFRFERFLTPTTMIF